MQLELWYDYGLCWRAQKQSANKTFFKHPHVAVEAGALKLGYLALCVARVVLLGSKTNETSPENYEQTDLGT